MSLICLHSIPKLWKHYVHDLVYTVIDTCTKVFFHCCCSSTQAGFKALLHWITPLSQHAMFLSKHFALCPQRWGSLLGTGTWGERVKAWPRAPTHTTDDAMDRCQNDQNVKAASPCHCAATSVLRNCCLNCSFCIAASGRRRGRRRRRRRRNKGTTLGSLAG